MYKQLESELLAQVVRPDAGGNPILSRLTTGEADRRLRPVLDDAIATVQTYNPKHHVFQHEKKIIIFTFLALFDYADYSLHLRGLA